MFAVQTEDWAHMVPMKAGQTAERVDRLFATVAAFVSLKVRDAASSSLKNFVQHMESYMAS